MTNDFHCQNSNAEGPEVSRRDFFQHTVRGARRRCGFRDDYVRFGAGPVRRGSLCLEIHRRLSRFSQRAPVLRPMRPFPPTCGMSDRRAADQPERLVPLLLSAASRSLPATRGC
jgi:hypothetical protein